eukprot:NODE_10939_length_483_cov_2.097222_g10285_i0.p1 GENE.NODE_10939_length_483_cov_2.097222_g10285_i0~~NODE_10939_length_483_cov_2.097222_g10285_i0.p1  ORF type:complete len:151 (+),score=20.59 NODE_10939_length_483_cov_2.097222_g10285_i0:56-454(+)
MVNIKDICCCLHFSIRNLSIVTLILLAFTTTLSSLITSTITAQMAVEDVSFRYIDSQVIGLVTNLSLTFQRAVENNKYWVKYVRRFPDLLTLDNIKDIMDLGPLLNVPEFQISFKNGNFIWANTTQSVVVAY